MTKAVKENGKGILLKVNVDEAVKMAKKYSISSLPSVFAIRDGEVVGSFIGAQRPDVVNSFIETHAK